MENENTQESSLEEKCSGIMGVPITFLDKYCPEQFEIIGLAPERGQGNLQLKKYINAFQHNKDKSTCKGSKVNDGPTLLIKEIPSKFPFYTAENVEGYLLVLYARILIKRRT